LQGARIAHGRLTMQDGRSSRVIRLWLLLWLLATLAACQPMPDRATPPGRLILATTTSTQDSGLLDAILPDFERQANADVDVVAVGTGQALQLGKDCNADVVLVHARSREDSFMANDYGVRREDVMYTDFVILGPPGDPAGVRGMTDAAAALTMIAAAQAPFISRGDESGTHDKEKAVWKAASITPTGDWYIAAGQGMGAVLTMADEQDAYTLSDRATYLARTLEGMDLEVMVEDDPALFNPYSVIVVNPQKCRNTNIVVANQFADWITSAPAQELIASFGQAKYGQALFTPNSNIGLQHQSVKRER